jgi:hypothetical protein
LNAIITEKKDTNVINLKQEEKLVIKEKTMQGNAINNEKDKNILQEISKLPKFFKIVKIY